MSLHATRLCEMTWDVRCGFHVGPLGDPITLCVKGMQWPQNGNIIHCITPHGPVCHAPESRPGKEGVRWRAGGLGSWFLLEKRERNCGDQLGCKRDGQLQSWSWSVDFFLNRLENDLGPVRRGTTQPQKIQKPLCTPWAFVFPGVWDFLCLSYSSTVVSKIFQSFSFLFWLRDIIRLPPPLFYRNFIEATSLPQNAIMYSQYLILLCRSYSVIEKYSEC